MKGLNSLVQNAQNINWYPGHMYAGMKKMIGKLATVDCVIEVHDARLPTIGRNTEFKRHLGRIKPHILVLNKKDLADLSKWREVKRKLEENGDKNVILTNLSGSTFEDTGYTKLMTRAVELINESSRNNRMLADHFKIMIVGIPNVGKSSLVNRLRQYHLGLKGEPAKVGAMAGVTRHVDNRVRICARPPIYMIDTPGVLSPSETKDKHNSMRLALCSSINDDRLNPIVVASYLLDYLNFKEDYFYATVLGIFKPVKRIEDLYHLGTTPEAVAAGAYSCKLSNKDLDKFCWHFLKLFRTGVLGKVMF